MSDMSHVLIIIQGRNPGNRMSDPDNTSYTEQIIETNIKLLDIFCEKIVGALENFEDASNFQEEIEKIKPQLKIDNFAKIEFNYPTSKYDVTIVAPKFE